MRRAEPHQPTRQALGHLRLAATNGTDKGNPRQDRTILHAAAIAEFGRPLPPSRHKRCGRFAVPNRTRVKDTNVSYHLNGLTAIMPR